MQVIRMYDYANCSHYGTIMGYMKSGDNKGDTIRRVNAYIENRLAGDNKRDSGIKAGYSLETSETPSLIELTNTYGFMVQSVLLDNALVMTDTINEFKATIESKPVDWDLALKIITVIDKQTKVHDTLTPKVTVKQTTDAKGNKTTTAWGTNSAQLSETIGS